MARYGIDAPTLLHLVDAGRPADPSHQLVAPNAIRSDALQLLLHDVRAGRREERDALKTHTALTEVKLRLLGDRVSRQTAWRLAVDHGFETVADAEYLAVAKLQADAFVTVDERAAARAVPVVPVATVEALFVP